MAQGTQGETGEQGIQGTPGDNGDKGDNGDQGDQGPQGPQGFQGDQGLKGDQGDEGPRGPQGIEGPRGDGGAQGFQGIQGVQGADGTNGPTPNVLVIDNQVLTEFDVTGVTAILFRSGNNVLNSTIGAVEGQIIHIKVLFGGLNITDYYQGGTQIFWYNERNPYFLEFGEGCTIIYTSAHSTGRWYLID